VEWPLSRSTRRGPFPKWILQAPRWRKRLAYYRAKTDTLDARFADLPTRLIGDRGYDSDALDKTLMTTYGIEMIAAHPGGRRQITQDGRPLRRARRRCKIERLFAWLHNFRRLVTRWERHVDNFVAMLHLACARILLRHL
jgi:transposase